MSPCSLGVNDLAFSKNSMNEEHERMKASIFMGTKPIKRIVSCQSSCSGSDAEMVRRGWALAYRKYSEDYVRAE